VAETKGEAMSRLGTIIGTGILAALFLGSPTVVHAECPYLAMPSATDAARSAREVIVGTVVENIDGQLYDFRLRIDHVLRGDANVGDVRRFDFLYPGWPPLQDERGNVLLNVEGKPIMPCEAIPGAEGNVIVLALGALAPDGRTRYNGASWISDDRPRADLPRTTLAEITRLATMPDTATPSMPAGAARTQQWGQFPVALASGLAGVLAVLLLCLRLRPSNATPDR
jgi:hypothetical protein